jgi:hypothetical protein
VFRLLSAPLGQGYLPHSAREGAEICRGDTISRLPARQPRGTLGNMEKELTRNTVPSFIRRYMPNASDEELREATDVFRRYLEIVLRIHRRT